ncbi:MAG: uL14 family ribosomal protein [Candidatus Aenigmatarchaeota archaeon]
MKAIASSSGNGVQVGTVLKCADNSGANLVEVIAVLGYKGKRRSKPEGGVASLIVISVKTGNEKMRHEVSKAVVIRQRKEYRRANGMRVQFEDNAAVLVNDKYDPTATMVKGPMAREVADRFKTVGKIASMVV